MQEPSAASGPPADFVTFGPYRVARRPDGGLDELGKGMMGTTYQAYDPRLRIPIALKVIAAERVHDERARRRFEREASAAAQLEHPNIAGVKHLGEEGGAFFYAMEFVAGRSLADLLAEKGKLPVPAALALCAQVAAGLAAAHKHELIHRDLKPSNLMLLEGDAVENDDERTAAAGGRQVKVIDFGLARTFGHARLEDSLATMSASMGASSAGFTGTPTYASPEQCESSAEIDGRADLYSLGIILWQCLAGRVPFRGSIPKVIGMHQFQPPPMAQLEGQPVALIELLASLLEKAPAQRRPQTAKELRDRLDALRRELSQAPGAPIAPAPPAHGIPQLPPAPAAVAAPVAVVLPVSAPAVPHPPAAVPPRGPRSASSPPAPAGGGSRGLAWLGVLAGIVLVAGAGLFLLREAEPAPSAPKPLAAAPAPVAAPAPAAAARADLPAQPASPPLAGPRAIAAESARSHFAALLEQAKTIREDSERRESLRTLAFAQNAARDWDGARATAAAMDPESDGPDMLASVATAQGEAKDLAGARATAELITDPSQRDAALRQVVSVQLKVQNLREAKITAALIKDESAQSQALGEIALGQAKAGGITEAKAMLPQVKSESDRALVLSQIAMSQARREDWAAAKATAASITDEIYRARALAEIAKELASTGNVPGAKATAATINHPYLQSKALGHIARAQAKARKPDLPAARATFELARAAAARIEEPSSRAEALVELAAVQAKENDEAGAKVSLELAQRAAAATQGASGRDFALRKVALAQAAVRDVDGARATANLLASPLGRSDVLLYVAESQIQAGDPSGARATFELAKAAVATADPIAKVSALRSIGRIQARERDQAAAKATLIQAKAATTAMVEPTDRAKALGSIAAVQKRAGDATGSKATFGEARADADDPKSNFFYRAQALESIAMDQARAGEVTAAKATVGAIDVKVLAPVKAMRLIAAAQVWVEGIWSTEEWVRSQTVPRLRFAAGLGLAQAAGEIALGLGEGQPPELLNET